MSEGTTELVQQRTEAKKPLDIKGWLQNDGLKAQIAKALPKHCTADRMCRAGLTALTKTPALARCSVESFMEAFLTLSQWGLEPDGRHAHLIPYGNKVQLVIDYKGLIRLAYQGGFVKSIRSDVVCENDEYEENTGDVIRHVVNRRGDRGAVFAVYCVIELADGARHTEIMSRQEVEDVRKRSKAGESGPWKTDWNEMAKKTVFRRASKWIPLGAEVLTAFERDEDKPDFTQPKQAVTADHLEALLGGSSDA